MAGSLKKKINLTIDEDVLSRAKRVVEESNESLSQVVEAFLARLVMETENDSEGDWLRCFHEEYLVAGSSEPSDGKVQELRRGLLEKHS